MVPMNTDPTQQTERQWNDWGDLRVRIEPMQATGTSAAHPCRRRVGGLRSALEPMAGCGPARSRALGRTHSARAGSRLA